MHIRADDPTIRHRDHHVKVALSIYGLTSNGRSREVKQDPDDELSRLRAPYHLTVNGKDRTFSPKNYLNRHVIVPDDMDSDNYYYRIDDFAKNNEYKGLLVEVIGQKWIGSSKKIGWLCETVGSGKKFFTLYLDATSRISKSDPVVQAWLRVKKYRAQKCFREDDIAALINTMQRTINQLEANHIDLRAD